MRAALLAWSGVIVAAALVAGGAALAPEALRRVDEFHIARVMVHGAAYLEAAEAVAASGITPTSSLFDDEAGWTAGLRAHPLVRDARIERELPATLHLYIQETTPLALAQTPELRVVDAHGHVLPVGGGATDLDLPIVLGTVRLAPLETAGAVPGRGHLRIDDEPTLRALALLARLEALDPEFAAIVSDAKPLRAPDVQLTLRAPPGMHVLLPAAATREQLDAVRMTMAHLRAARDSTALRVRIDARYRDQVVVAPLPAPNRSNTGGAR